MTVAASFRASYGPDRGASSTRLHKDKITSRRSFWLASRDCWTEQALRSSILTKKTRKPSYPRERRHPQLNAYVKLRRCKTTEVLQWTTDKGVVGRCRACQSESASACRSACACLNVSLGGYIKDVSFTILIIPSVDDASACGNLKTQSLVCSLGNLGNLSED
jgi:hypothetical protein